MTTILVSASMRVRGLHHLHVAFVGLMVRCSNGLKQHSALVSVSGLQNVQYLQMLFIFFFYEAVGYVADAASYVT